ncbi:TlpA disulfide reductase family protein [Pelomonas sp. APW6]|uniref:TlpA disulfide reductase family protein n=1 Tax=Roseateles subflavus TaxID=3053353 RepID=A0ABT7LIQ5_9BURK|nr:TlpA disulfide reductase family protein [Pelomonas sp. APW6]MDL5032752.1 TlpA disulfide reductase family protein [Pelomonas sp. APW6]
MNRRHALFGTVGLAAAGFGAWLARRGQPVEAPLPALPPRPASAADAFWMARFERVDGSELAARELRGQPLLLNFWATWCAPCVRELPEIQQFLAAQPGWQGLALAIDRKEAVQDFLTKLPLQMPLALGGVQGLELGRQLGNTQGGLPFSVVFDARGQVFWRRLGALQAGELEAVAHALATGQPAPEAGKTGA